MVGDGQLKKESNEILFGYISVHYKKRVALFVKAGAIYNFFCYSLFFIFIDKSYRKKSDKGVAYYETAQVHPA